MTEEAAKASTAMATAPSSPTSQCTTVSPHPRRRELTTRYHLVPLVGNGDKELGGSLRGSDSSFFGDVIPIIFGHSSHDVRKEDEGTGRIPSPPLAAGARAGATMESAGVVARDDGTMTDWWEGVVRPPATVVSFSEPLGRGDIVASLLSSCRDPFCRGGGGSGCGDRSSSGRRRRRSDDATATEREALDSKGSKKRRRSSRRRWCRNCSDVVMAQCFLSKSMLRFSLSPSVGGKGEDAEEIEEAGTVLRLYVAGPNALMVHLNGVPVVSAVEDSTGQHGHDDAGATTVPDGMGLAERSGAPSSSAASRASRLWRDGGHVRPGDVLSLVNLDATTTSSGEQSENGEAKAPPPTPTPTSASAQRAEEGDGDEGCRHHHRRKDRNWSPLRFVIASSASAATGESEVIGGPRRGEHDASSVHESPPPTCASITDAGGQWEYPNAEPAVGRSGEDAERRGQQMTGADLRASSPQQQRHQSGRSTPRPSKGARDVDDVEKCNDGDGCGRGGGGGLHVHADGGGGDDVDNGGCDEDDDGGPDGVVEVEMEDSSPMLTMPRFSHPSAAAEHLFTATATATATCTYGGGGGGGTKSDAGTASPADRHGRWGADLGSSASMRGGSTPSSGLVIPTEAEDVVPVASLGVDEIRRLRDNYSLRGHHPPSSFRHALLSIALMREDRLARRRGRQHGGVEHGGAVGGDVPPRHRDHVDDGETGGVVDGDSPSSSRLPIRLPTLLRDTVVRRSDIYPT